MRRSGRSLEVNEHQGSLVQDTSEFVAIASESFPDDPTEKMLGHIEAFKITYGAPGSYVNLAERATHLTEALAAFGLRNQRLGFDTASNTRKHNGPIWARYRQLVPRVQEGAESNAVKYLQRAKLAFWHATGCSALRGTGITSTVEIDAGARKMWREFSTQYGDPAKIKDRDQYKRTLARTKKNHQKILMQQAEQYTK